LTRNRQPVERNHLFSESGQTAPLFRSTSEHKPRRRNLNLPRPAENFAKSVRLCYCWQKEQLERLNFCQVSTAKPCVNP
jgi:hypothetical protein